MEIVYVHLSKNGWRKSGLLTDPELTDTVLIISCFTSHSRILHLLLGDAIIQPVKGCKI
jgi:hypothetical protein